MKKFFIITAAALGLFCLTATAQPVSIVTVTVTNQPVGTGETLIVANSGYAAFTFTPTNTVAAGANTNFLIGADINTTVANLFACITTNATLATSTYNKYITPTVFTLTFPPGQAPSITFGGNWATVQTTVIPATNTAVAIVTNSVTVFAATTLLNSVAPTNAITLPSLTVLQANYKPGQRFLVRKIDGLTNGVALTAGTGTSLIASGYEGLNSVTNNFVLGTPTAFGTFKAQLIITNAYPLDAMWDGTTNYVLIR